MRLAHEPLGTDIVDMELIELKFIFDRRAYENVLCTHLLSYNFITVHHDNRDLTVIPNYQPAASPLQLSDQLELWGKSEGVSTLFSVAFGRQY